MTHPTKQERCPKCNAATSVPRPGGCSYCVPDSLTSNQQFRDVPALVDRGWKLAEIERNQGNPLPHRIGQLYIGRSFLTVEEALLLRNWLNSALPDETSPNEPTPHGVIYDRLGWVCSICGGWNHARDKGCTHTHITYEVGSVQETSAVRAGVSVKDPTPPQEIILCAAMGPSGFICERPKDHSGRHCDGDNTRWDAENGKGDGT